jgi:hypothetical protein
MCFGYEKATQVLVDLHEWRMMVNDEGQRYKTCASCGAYCDFDLRPGVA